jgi:hypothetical protein
MSMFFNRNLSEVLLHKQSDFAVHKMHRQRRLPTLRCGHSQVRFAATAAKGKVREPLQLSEYSHSKQARNMAGVGEFASYSHWIGAGHSSFTISWFQDSYNIAGQPKAFL